MSGENLNFENPEIKKTEREQLVEDIGRKLNSLEVDLSSPGMITCRERATTTLRYLKELPDVEGNTDFRKKLIVELEGAVSRFDAHKDKVNADSREKALELIQRLKEII